MRTLSAALQAAQAARITTPVYLVQIDFSPVTRLSTWGDISWNGESWSGGERVSVSGLSSDGRGVQTGQIEVGNVDLLMGTLVLGQGVADRAVTIWGGDATALDPADMEPVFTGVIASASIDPERHVVSLALTSDGSLTRRIPRRRIDAASGFNTLIPAGKEIWFGGNKYTLERR